MSEGKGMKKPKQLRIVAEKTEIKHVKAGDLFSDLGPDYWSKANNMPSVSVLMRTHAEIDDDPNMVVYKLTIVMQGDNVEDSNTHIRQPAMSPYVPPGMTHDEWNKK